MRVLAYCCLEFAESVQKAAGVVALTCPPLSAFGGPGSTAIRPQDLEGYDVLYFKLHGLPGEPFWYGDDLRTAITSDVVRSADLSGAVAFVASCHLWTSGKGDTERPMLDALLDAGCAVVVGGGGENFGKRRDVYGADLLGKWFVMAMRLGAEPLTAFYVAKARVSLDSSMGAVDALKFRIFTQEKEHD
jgi:hypothetical protein